MGGNSSREIRYISSREAKLEALRNFDRRIEGYSYAYHGNYTEYVEWCREQFELECIPHHIRQCPQQDGNEIY